MTVPTQAIVKSAKAIRADKPLYSVSCKIGMTIGVTIFVASLGMYVVVQTA